MFNSKLRIQNSTLLLLLLVIAAGAAWVVFTAYITRHSYVHSDMARMAVFIAKIAEPGRYSSDYLFSAPDSARFYAPVMTQSLAWMLDLTGSLADGRALVYTALMAFYLPGAALLFRLISGRWALAVPLAFVTALPYGLAQDTAVFWGIQDTIAQTFFNALAPYLIALLWWAATRPPGGSRGWQWIALGFALGLSANVHPQSAIMWVALYAVTGIALLAWGRVKWWLPLLAVPGIALGALPYATTFLGAGGAAATSPADWQQFTETLNIGYGEPWRLERHLRGWLPRDLTFGFLFVAVPAALILPLRARRRAWRARGGVVPLNASTTRRLPRFTGIIAAGMAVLAVIAALAGDFPLMTLAAAAAWLLGMIGARGGVQGDLPVAPTDGAADLTPSIPLSIIDGEGETERSARSAARGGGEVPEQPGPTTFQTDTWLNAPTNHAGGAPENGAFTHGDLLLTLGVAFFTGLVIAVRTFSGALFVVLWGYWLWLALWRRRVEWPDALLLIWLVAIIFGADVAQRFVHYGWLLLPGNTLIFGLDYEFWRMLLFVYAPLFGMAARWARRTIGDLDLSGVGARYASPLQGTPQNEQGERITTDRAFRWATWALVLLFFLSLVHNRLLSFRRADFLFNEDWAVLIGLALLLLGWPLYRRWRETRFGPSLDAFVWGTLITVGVAGALRVVSVFQSPGVIALGVGASALVGLLWLWSPAEGARGYQLAVSGAALVLAVLLAWNVPVDTRRIGDAWGPLGGALLPDAARMEGAWEFAARDPLANPGGLYQWARDETPAEARFLYPQEDCVWFRYYTARSLVACTVDTFNVMYSHGVRGFLDVYALNEAALAAYDSPGALLVFAREHEADYIITAADWPGTLDLEVAYVDEQFRVYVVGE